MQTVLSKGKALPGQLEGFFFAKHFVEYLEQHNLFSSLIVQLKTKLNRADVRYRMCVCSFFAELLCWWLSFFQFFISSKQRRKTWLAAQVAARHSTNTSGAGSVENDGSDHVVTVDQEAPSPVVDVRSNFQVGEKMRF